MISEGGVAAVSMLISVRIRKRAPFELLNWSRGPFDFPTKVKRIADYSQPKMRGHALNYCLW